MKRILTSAVLACLLTTPVSAQDLGLVVDGIAFGDDSGLFNNDGECDDRRFVGPAMATSIGWELIGRDASDCANAYQAGQVRQWVFADALAQTQCTRIDFGNDSGDFPQDCECDDIRFEGPGSALALSPNNVGADATDCQRLCTFGVIAVRDY